MKKNYLTPLLEVETVKLEHDFLASKKWYEKHGADYGGDVDFDIEEDETWG